jgi:hypothetical protein
MKRIRLNNPNAFVRLGAPKHDPLAKINQNLKRLGLLRQPQAGGLDPVALLRKTNTAIKRLVAKARSKPR